MRLGLLTSLIAACLLLPACGGDDEDGETNGAGTLSVREYRQQADRICRQAEKAAKELPEPRTDEGLITYLERQLPLTSKYQGRYEALKPPAQLAAAHREGIRQGRDAIAFFRRLARQLRSSDDLPAVFRDAVPKIAEIVDEGNAGARELGLKDCIEEFPGPGLAEPRSS